jgi:tRNA A37 threonylcarbamoyladenosine modification protein TsaB
VAVSALEVLAQIASDGRPPGTLIGAWMDAHRLDVFSAAYRVGVGPRFDLSRLEEMEPPQVGRAGAILTRWTDEDRVPAVIIGDGAMLFAEVVGDLTTVMAPPTLAGAIGRLAVSHARLGRTLAPAAVQPLYIRRPDVEITREQGKLAAPGVRDPRS